ncbi:hypothetical protein K505DRAFT_380111 [Melanomma pulvis-pyrius CBS 109.77]|uniref:Uncharacterized protein n=1 Tax=Melanomma pulvis-pyrius CBS 109.77 TaxID=1314802 RepID=A0A6A6WRH0_9PLEO|nr:hypothetical protein K505DRAFT_380111 [Melanomma pulvis-pyrius CBS 109.77]
MQPQLLPAVQRAFSTLPIELFLNVLDQLVGTHDGCPPVAYAPSDSITKALRALTLVSRGIYPIASQYLYANCLYLDSCTSYSQFRRTLGLHLGTYHPQSLRYGQAGLNEQLFAEADILRHITSLFLSPQKTAACGGATPMVRLPQIIDLCEVVGPTLTRLAIDLQPIYASTSEIERVKPHSSEKSVFMAMHNLEDLVCSFDVTDYFPQPPPNLKRLAITSQGTGTSDVLIKFCLGIQSLEVLFFLRDPEMEAADVDTLFEHYEGEHLDVVLVDVNANHCTPKGARDWKPEDRVTVWEVDVPKSYYGDEGDLILCDSWFWMQGVRGTLFTQEKRRMTSWSQVQAKMAALQEL